MPLTWSFWLLTFCRSSSIWMVSSFTFLSSLRLEDSRTLFSLRGGSGWGGHPVTARTPPRG